MTKIKNYQNLFLIISLWKNVQKLNLQLLKRNMSEHFSMSFIMRRILKKQQFFESNKDLKQTNLVLEIMKSIMDWAKKYKEVRIMWLINFLVQQLIDFLLKRLNIINHKQKVNCFHFTIKINCHKIKVILVLLGSKSLLTRKIMDFYQLMKRKLNSWKMMKIYLVQGSMKYHMLKVYSNPRKER